VKRDLVIPEATIYSEHPVAIIDKNVTALIAGVDAFVQYLWSDEAQADFVSITFAGHQRGINQKIWPGNDQAPILY